MSLIDEALKRAELEAARRDGLRGGAYPWVLESQPKRRRRWVAAAVIGLTVAILGGGVVWLSRRPAAVPASGAPAGGGPKESNARNPKSRIEMETVEVAPPPKAQPVRAPAAGKAEPEAKPAGASSSPAAGAEAGRAKGAAAAPRPASPAEGRAGSPGAAGKPATRGLAPGKTFFGEVELPEGGKIALEGIVWSETNPVALINGKVLPPGGVVEEFTIAAIQPDRVELNGRGMTIFLALK